MTTFLIHDIETLGEEPPAALIEHGWHSVEAYGHGGYRLGAMSGARLFGMGGQEMTPDSRAVHHINPDFLRGLTTFHMNLLMDWDHEVDYHVAHNSSFEEQWLKFERPWICTYKCALQAFPDSPSHSNQCLKYFLGMPDRDDLHPPHRALPDAKVTAYLLTRLLDRHPAEVLLEWTKAPRLILKMPFGKHRGARLDSLPTDYLSWVSGPRCEAAEPDLKYACEQVICRRSAVSVPSGP